MDHLTMRIPRGYMGSEARTVGSSILRVGIGMAALGALLIFIVPARPGRFLEYDLDVGGEGNVFAWASTVATFAAAYASALLAFTLRGHSLRLTVLAVCFALLSLDDMAQVHERLGAKVFHEWLGLPADVSEQLEVLLYAPLFAVALWIVWTLLGDAPRQISVVLIIGVSLLGLAVVSEVGGVVTRRLEGHVPRVNGVRLGIEEASELAGWILVATALTALACTVIASAGSDVTGARDRRGTSSA